MEIGTNPHGNLPNMDDDGIKKQQKTYMLSLHHAESRGSKDCSSDKGTQLAELEVSS